MKKRIFIVAAVVVVVVASGVFGVEAWLRHSVQAAVERALDGVGATVRMGRVSVSLPRRQITLCDVHLTAQNNDTAHRGFTVVSLDMTLPRVTVRGLRYRGVGERLAANLLTVEDARVTLVTLDGDATTRLELGGCTLSARSLRLDSLPSSLSFIADSVVCHLPDDAQVIRVDSVMLDTSAGTFSLRNLSLIPRFTKDLFAARVRKDWTRVSFGAIACTEVDYHGLVTQRSLSIDSIHLASGTLESYKNRKTVQDSGTKKMLYETIQQLPFPLYVRTLSFCDLDMAYEELAGGSVSPGTVTLTGGRGVVTNLTNIPAAVPTANDRFITIDLASATFMHGGSLEARFLFPVDATDDHWELAGRLGPTPMSVFNPALEPLANIKVTSGEIRSCDFHITGTLTKSHSTITLAYSDLQVDILDRRDHTHTRKFLTVMADRVLIRPDNPGRDGRGHLRKADGDHARDPGRSMWNYIWHSLFPAIVRTIT